MEDMTEASSDFTAGPPPIGYKDALEELEGILAELEDDDIDVDILAARVRRASELLVFCRRRITETRFEIERVVSEMEMPEADSPRSSDADPWSQGNDSG